MLLNIIIHTPVWVWGIFLLLLWLGFSQSVARTASLGRVIILPIAMTGLSLHGSFWVFHNAPLSWILWLGAAITSVAWFASAELPQGVVYDPQLRVYHLPGSWQPMALMMAIFLTRYVVGVTLALHPALAQDTTAAAIVASVYGALSGVFIGRMVCMLTATRAKRPVPVNGAVSWG
jgi:hypothetical protein